MNVTEMKQAISNVLGSNLVPMILGPPGIGKSDIIRSIAEEYKLNIIDMRLSQCDPTDLLGFPMHDGERMSYVPPKDIPLQSLDKIPESTNGWLLFLDEFPSAPLAVQAASYKLALDKMVGQHPIHKKCYIVCAGNGEADGGIVNRLSTPMQSRLIHLELQVDARAWLDWAIQSELDHRIISYVEGRPEHLHEFDPNHNDKTFACPRTWEFASKLIKNKEPTPLMKELLIGTLSSGIGHSFFAYLHYYSELPSLHDIQSRPEEISIPEEPALIYAISHMVAANMNEKNSARFIRFIDRLPLDFGVTAIRAALKRDKTLIDNVSEVRAWAHKLADEIF